jgi:hypothetical protein
MYANKTFLCNISILAVISTEGSSSKNEIKITKKGAEILSALKLKIQSEK